MKRQIKIRGFAYGRNQTITKTMEVPEFFETDEKLGEINFKSTIQDKERQWIDENYQRIIDGVFNVSLDVIFDVSFVQPKYFLVEKEKELNKLRERVQNAENFN